MQIVGLTGNIAAGKSEVSRRLAARGATLIDADQLAREAVAPGSPALDAIVARWGPTVLQADGMLDRTAMRRIIFADPNERTALAWGRTSLAIAVNALLSFRAGLVLGEASLVAIGAVLFAAAGATVAVGTIRRRQLSGDILTITPPRWALPGVAAATVVASLAGVASVLVEGGSG